MTAVVPPSPVAGLREAIVFNALTLVMAAPTHEQAEIVRAALLDEPVPLDVERLARALEVLDDDPDILPSLHADEVAAEYARLTDPKGATDGE